MMDETNKNDANGWWIFKGMGVPHDEIRNRLPPPPNWRKFSKVEDEKLIDPQLLASLDDEETKRHIGDGFQVSKDEIELVNAALYLRRPLLITGKPGSGKSSLAYAVAHELKLGRVLHWPITTHSTLIDGLYHYDAIGRLEDASLKEKRFAANDPTLRTLSLDVGRYMRLGPLGTALLPWKYPRVLLIDEIDKSDIDLPNDLLNIFEEGEFNIPKLMPRLAYPAYDNDNSDKEETKQTYVMPDGGKRATDRVPISNGHVKCHTFPFVILTSNGEREFPPAFLRRCLRLEMQLLDRGKLEKIVAAHLGKEALKKEETELLIENFLTSRTKGDLATDQLLNAVYMSISGVTLQGKEKLRESLLKYLTENR